MHEQCYGYPVTLFHGNLPDAIWTQLKAWAKIQADADLSPRNDECVAQVLHITSNITGRADTLRPEVVAFYANETVEMIEKFRESAAVRPPEDAGAAGLEPV
jgi:hypothetical protein